MGNSSASEVPDQIRNELNWYPKRSKFYSKYKRGDEHDHLAFGVGDVNAALKKLIPKGVEVAV